MPVADNCPGCDDLALFPHVFCIYIKKLNGNANLRISLPLCNSLRGMAREHRRHLTSAPYCRERWQALVIAWVRDVLFHGNCGTDVHIFGGSQVVLKDFLSKNQVGVVHITCSFTNVRITS